MKKVLHTPEGVRDKKATGGTYESAITAYTGRCQGHLQPGM